MRELPPGPGHFIAIRHGDDEGYIQVTDSPDPVVAAMRRINRARMDYPPREPKETDVLTVRAWLATLPPLGEAAG